ncbi:MAG: alpha/beta hydrolase [Pirellulales bacterium]|nr:alpha/beta hydrolase [Pirellulales bacterium]
MALFYLLVVIGMMLLEKRLIYFPARWPQGDWSPLTVPREDAWFAAPDGVKLHGWFVPHAQPRAVMLIASGNAGNVTVWRDELEWLHAHGVAAMVFDYRGYGRSEGKPDEAGLLADARAARAWLARRCGVAETDVVLRGRSLGGAVMVDLAAAAGARGLVLESTFTSLPDVAAHFYFWLPVRLLMRTRFDSLSKIGRYQGPLLQSHGDADEIVPFFLGRRLFDAAGGPKQWITIPGGRHNDPQSVEFYQALDRFLDSNGKGEVAGRAG